MTGVICIKVIRPERDSCAPEDKRVYWVGQDPKCMMLLMGLRNVNVDYMECNSGTQEEERKNRKQQQQATIIYRRLGNSDSTAAEPFNVTFI